MYIKGIFNGIQVYDNDESVLTTTVLQQECKKFVAACFRSVSNWVHINNALLK
jgi:hypothetical protein